MTGPEPFHQHAAGLMRAAAALLDQAATLTDQSIGRVFTDRDGPGGAGRLRRSGYAERIAELRAEVVDLLHSVEQVTGGDDDRRSPGCPVGLCPHPALRHVTSGGCAGLFDGDRCPCPGRRE